MYNLLFSKFKISFGVLNINEIIWYLLFFKIYIYKGLYLLNIELHAYFIFAIPKIN